LEITADLSGKKVVDLAMTGNCRRPVSCAVHVDGMFAAFPKKLTAMLFEVPYQVIPLHAV
jgi:hypothetical protein